MKNPYMTHIILGTSKTDKFIMSAVISKRFKNYMPTLVSCITVLPAAVKLSNLKEGLHCGLLEYSSTSHTHFIAHVKISIGAAGKYFIFSSKINVKVILLAGIHETICDRILENHPYGHTRIFKFIMVLVTAENTFQVFL